MSGDPCRSRCHADFGSVSSNVDARLQNISVQNLHANCANFCTESVGALAATSATVTCLTSTHDFTTQLPVEAGTSIAPPVAGGLALTADITLTAAELLQGTAAVISSNAARAITFPSVSEIVSAISSNCGAAPSNGDSFDFSIVTHFANTLLVGAVSFVLGTDMTSVVYGGVGATGVALLPTNAAAVTASSASIAGVPVAFLPLNGRNGQKITWRFTYNDQSTVAPLIRYDVRVIESVVSPLYTLVA
jgi:hypothetical protein